MPPIDRCLVIEPIGGLCNRLLALAFAHRLAERSRRRLIVAWGNHHPSQPSQSNCALDDLFAHDLTVATAFDADARASLVWLASYPRHTPWEGLARAQAIAFDPDHVELDAHDAVPTVAITARTPLFAHGDRPDLAVQAAAQVLLRLRPVPAIESAVQAFRRAHFQGPMLGLHVRRGDHGALLARIGVEQPAEEDYWAYAQACLAARADLRVFCATDDAGVKQRFHERFGMRGCSHPAASLDRATRDGVSAALIDLLLLSHAAFLGGTPHSTFTLTAAFRNLMVRASYDACCLDIRAGLRHHPAALAASAQHTIAAIEQPIGRG